jgi:hypothetical protein
MACCAARAAEGTEFFDRKSFTSLAREAEQKEPNDPITSGIAWNMFSDLTRAGQRAFVNSHA